MSFIEVDKLCKSFDYYEKDVGLKNSVKNLFHRKKLVREAVREVSFQIEEGEVVGFLGPNGAGKTTTLKMLSGILFPTAGKISVMGYVPYERKKEFKRKFSIVMGQKSQLWWDLPAAESIYLNKCIYEINDKDYQSILGELTEVLDVKDLLKVQVRRLSLGERMKMELIASLIHKPRVLFLDEPTIGLDIISQKKIREFIANYNSEHKTTIMLTSHYISDIESLCKRVIVINQGRTIYDGDLMKVNELFNEKKILKLNLSSPVDKQVFEAYGKIISFDGLNAVMEVNKNDLGSFTKTMLETLPVYDFTAENIPVEEGISLLFRKENENGYVSA